MREPLISVQVIYSPCDHHLTTSSCAVTRRKNDVLDDFLRRELSYSRLVKVTEGKSSVIRPWFPAILNESMKI